MKRNLMLLFLSLLLVTGLAITGCAEEQEKHAIFGTSTWSGDWFPPYPIKILLEEEFGYTTEFVQMAVPAIWGAISTGDAHIWASSWQPNQEKLKEEYADTTEQLGLLYGDCLQGWMVPKGVAEEYGLSKIEDLKDPELAKLFDVDGDGVGDLMGCDSSWACAEINDEELAAYGLDELYEQKYGSESMMIAAIEGRLKKDQPVLFYIYTPHPFFVRYPIGEDVVWLEDSKDFWPVANVYSFANKEWIEQNPQAAELIGQVEMTEAEIGWSMAEIEERGDDPATLEALAREWMAEHQNEIESWVSAAKAK